MTRSSGILMPLFALPSPYGIGTLGKAAFDFIDFLSDAGQRVWQLLPLGPTSYGDSPYSSFSSFAGNPYFVDLDILIADGLLTQAEVSALDWGSDPEHVDYTRLYEQRFDILRLAADRGVPRDREAFGRFCEEQKRWLGDYSLYMALKRRNGMRPWQEWPEEYRLRHPDALSRSREELASDIELFSYIQFLFFRQWDTLRAYARDKHILLVGDLPIYVAMDSADVWAEPQWFQLDGNGFPTEVAGVPPDYFNEDGQLWGNPLYRWDAMAQDGYSWWISRVGGTFRLFDIVRFDHFRGLESYWAVPYGDATARGGRWVKGPGLAFVRALADRFPNQNFIAEDLGFLTPEVKDLLAASGFPGMKVLQFAFDWREPSDYLPHTYTRDCVCYTGTHDNTTLRGWLTETDPRCLVTARRYLGIGKKEGFVRGMLRGGMSSVADLFIAQMQDWLDLGEGARVNTPGTSTGNWQWRMRADVLTPKLCREIRKMTILFGRA